MSDALKSRLAGFFVQPGGANKQVYFIGCAEVDDFEEPLGGTELIQCFDPLNDQAWKTKGSLSSPPDPTGTSFSTLFFPESAIFDKLKNGYAIYNLFRAGGTASQFASYLRGTTMQKCTTTNITNTAAKRSEESEAEKSFDVEGEPPMLRTYQIKGARQTTTFAEDLNDIYCLDEGDDVYFGQGSDAIIVGNSAIAPALSTPEITVDSGATWTGTATDPFAAGESIMSVQRFFIDRTTVRTLCVRDSDVAAALEVAYSDDNGATWANVTVGATVAQAAVGHGSLFALDASYIWLCVDDGMIYFSEDGGETWTTQTDGSLTANSLSSIHFLDENIGFCVGSADTVLRTINGGDTWELATATGGAGTLNDVKVLDGRIWVVDDTPALYYSEDNGVTWNVRAGLPGSASAADYPCIEFANEFQGFLVSNTAGPVGTVLRTINGGMTWATVETPDNDGINAIHLITANDFYAVGPVEAGSATAYIAKFIAS